MKRQLGRRNRRINPPRCPILTCVVGDLPNETLIRIYDGRLWHSGIIYNNQCGTSYILANYKLYHGQRKLCIYNSVTDEWELKWPLCIYNSVTDEWELKWPQQKDTKGSQK